MSWWEKIYARINVGDEFQTPGKGLEGAGRKQFKAIYKEADKIIILSGRSCLPLERPCIEAIEDAFNKKPYSKWRVSSLRDNQPYEDSADNSSFAPLNG
ncbi:MAG: hypothetical protein P8168_14840 [Deltaproteobacteria bacterium]